MVVFVRMRYQIASVLIIFLFFSVSLIQLRPNKGDNPITPVSNPSTLSQYDDPNIITSNGDFASQGWSGNGSKTNPYSLDGITYYSHRGKPAFTISNTDAFFVLSNSVIHREDYGDWSISLSNVTNAVISNCNVSYGGIYGVNVFNSSIENCRFRSYRGLFLENSTRCNLSGNMFSLSFADEGINLVFSSNITVSDNLVLYTEYGIKLEASNYCTLTNNSVIECYHGMRIGRDSMRNVVYNNSVGWARYSTVVDDGSDNQWDDNISRGNAYSDYSGSGSYEIPGESGSVDRYPNLLDKDVYGPRIDLGVQHWETEYYLSCPEFMVIETIVSDISGVDTVLLNFNGTIYTMNDAGNRPSAGIPFIRFIYDLHNIEDYLGLFFIGIWANDTLGNSMETEFDYSSFGCPTKPLRDPITDITLFLFILTTGVSVCLIVWYVYYQRSRE
jgi:parallel beta-helix repeat protein